MDLDPNCSQHAVITLEIARRMLRIKEITKEFKDKHVCSGIALCCCRGRLSTTGLRFISRLKKRKNGPLPWMAEQLPTGRTSYAIQLTQMQNKDLWRKRMDKVNFHWQQMLRDYNKVKQQRDSGLINQDNPTKLLMVRQIKTLGGCPYWEKNIVKELKLEFDKPVIVKNREYTNALLKKVKHLVEVHPVTFPYGLPESEEDYAHCVLRDNGEFVVTKKLTAHSDDKSVPVTTEHPQSVWNIKQKLIDDTLERRKMLYMVHQEYFPTKYVYKRNQDGKEYRYKGDHSIGSDKIWY